MYPFLKHAHMLLVGISFCLFLWRFLVYRRRNQQLPKLFSVMPHCVDSLLLFTAIAMVWTVGYSWKSPWLLAKIVALLCYIAMGTLAMKSKGGIKWLGFILACLCFSYLVMVAVTKTPWGIF